MTFRSAILFASALFGLGTVARAEPEAQDVVVSGRRPPPTGSARDRGVASSVIRGDRLLAPGESTAGVLREAPGVQVTEIGGLGAPATASLRGATAAQTPVYFAGIRINDEVGGAANLADVPLFLIDRLEVYRSHAPLFADRLGLGGAIFLEPRVPRSDEIVTGAEVGSYGTREGHLYAAAVGNGRRLLAGVQFAAAQNDYEYYDDRGTLFTASDDSRRRLGNADVQLSNAWLTASESLGDAEVLLLVHHTDRAQGASKLALTPSRQARVGYRRDLFALRTRLPIRALNGDLTLSTQAISAETVTTDPLLELGWSLAETRTPGQRVEQSVEATERPFEHLRLSQRFAVAVDSMQRFERRSGTLDPAVSARRLGARVGGSFELQLARDWFIDGTAGLSCNDTSTGLLAVCDRVDGDGRVGLRYRRPSYELYSNVGRYLREPTLGELYGVAPLVRGNADLVPERGTSYELGARVQWRGARRTPLLYADVAAFSRFSDDLVTYVRTAQGFLTPTNDKRARALGGELVVGTAPVSFFEASSQLSLLDARDTSPDRTARNDVLPFHSRLVSTTLVTFEQRFESDWLSQVGTTARWLYQSSRYADPAGLGVIPAQSSLDLELFLRSLDRISTRARVANLLDQRRFDVVGFPLPGRSAFVSVEATW